MSPSGSDGGKAHRAPRPTVSSCELGGNFCAECAIAEFCRPVDPGATAHSLLGEISPQHRTLTPGESLFRLGDEFDALYGIRSGCLKTSVVDAKGNEHIINFHLPGELIGLDAIYPTTHRSDAVALSESVVCALPFRELLKLASTVPALQWRLFTIMSREVFYSATLSGECTAAERLAAFLLGLSARFAALKLSANEFLLPMSREEIANHLRLTAETISRLLRRFQDEGLLTVDQRRISILDRERLRIEAGPLNRWPAERRGPADPDQGGGVRNMT